MINDWTQFPFLFNLQCFCKILLIYLFFMSIYFYGMKLFSFQLTLVDFYQALLAPYDLHIQTLNEAFSSVGILLLNLPNSDASIAEKKKKHFSFP